jgi:hypothetical protein
MVLLGTVATSYHRVDRVVRVLRFYSSRWNWDSPTPSPAEECGPPLVPGGGANSLAGEGVGGPNNSEGTYTVVL